MKTILTILTILITLLPLQLNAQVEVIINAKLQKYIAKYELVKDLTVDFKDANGKFLSVVLRNLDDPKAPLLGFVEQNTEVTAAILRTSSKVTVEAHATDKEKIVVWFYDDKGKKFFSSSLSPFEKK